MAANPGVARPDPATRTRHRRFAVAWRDSVAGRIHAIGVLEAGSGGFEFWYRHDVAEVDGFRLLPGFPETGRVYRAPRLFVLFAQRVMDRDRPDYAQYLAALALPGDANELDVLSRTGGFRKGDRLQVAEEPEVDDAGRAAITFLVRGTRHVPEDRAHVETALRRLERDDPLLLIPDSANPVNPKALFLATLDGQRLGWIPDLLLGFFEVMHASGELRLAVLQVNGSDLPDHMRVVATVAGTVPVGFRAFGGPVWAAPDEVPGATRRQPASAQSVFTYSVDRAPGCGP